MNTVDLLASIDSKVSSLDLSNLTSSHTKNLCFKNSSGSDLLSIDDSTNITTITSLSVQNGFGATWGGNQIVLNSIGTTITSDTQMYGNLSVTGSFGIAIDINFHNLIQTNIIANKSLVLSQTGDQYGSTI